jgi:proteasome lid subunit RPN8/RPN11
MSLVIEVFRSDDYVPAGEIPLLPLLRVAFEEIIGPDAKGVRFDLYFYELLDLTRDRGKPSLVNLRASHGFVRVRIWRDGELLYQHPHPIRELIGEPLRELLRIREPDVEHWGYGVNGPGLESIAMSRPAPRVTHELRVASGGRRRSTFTVEEMPDPEPPQTTLARLGADAEPARTGPHPLPALVTELRTEADAPPPPVPGQPDDQAPPVVIAVPDPIVNAFVQTFPFSEEIEEGGFLAGKVYRDSDRPGGYLVHVTAAIPAERTGASMINFTFTGESFLRVSEQLASRGEGEVLLGWYHTHLFPATSGLGLSSVDVELHRSTFRRPWQVAALVNISTGGRVLRFYHGEGDEMAKVPYWTVPS